MGIIGQKFGRLTATESAGRKQSNEPLYKCVCDCGRERIVGADCLNAGLTFSCGRPSCIEGAQAKPETTRKAA